MDQTVAPCDNFYEFACGKFVKTTVVHDRYGSEGFQSFVQAQQDETLRRILDSPEDENELKPFKLAKRTYKMCIDHEKLNEMDSKPLLDIINDLGGWSLLSTSLEKEDFKWQSFYESVFRKGFAKDFFMSVYLTPDAKQKTKYIVKISPPSKEDFNRGYYEYLPMGLKSKQIKAYYDYMIEYMTSLGAEKEESEKQMLEVLEFEMMLQNVSLMNV